LRVQKQKKERERMLALKKSVQEFKNGERRYTYILEVYLFLPLGEEEE
jgi:hypothetical protein